MCDYAVGTGWGGPTDGHGAPSGSRQAAHCTTSSQTKTLAAASSTQSHKQITLLSEPCPWLFKGRRELFFCIRLDLAILAKIWVHAGNAWCKVKRLTVSRERHKASGTQSSNETLSHQFTESDAQICLFEETTLEN